jgi:tRNA (guanine-N7-)-methyltransferase
MTATNPDPPAPPWTAEHLSLFDARYLAFQGPDAERCAHLKASGRLRPFVRVVEIGCNRGDYLVGQARTWPDEQVVGFEWRAKYVRFAEERLQKQRVDNALVVHGDARIAVPLLFAPRSVGEFHVTFPDPWWRARHAERRILEPLFLRVLARRLVPGGRLYLKSDVFDYLYRVRAFAELSGAFVPLSSRLWPDESTWAPTTRERKCMDTALPYGRGFYQRRLDWNDALPETPEARDPAWELEDPDPQRLLRGAPLADRAARELHGRRWR